MDTSGFTQHPGSLVLVPADLAYERLAVAQASGALKTPAAAPIAPSFDAFPPELREPLGEEPGPLITLFRAQTLSESYERNRTQGPRNKVDRELVEALLRKLFRGGTLRRCALPEDWDARLDRLKGEHANFSEVVDFVQSEFSLAEVSNQPPRLPPILLNGPPSCGKTYFAEALSRVMGTGFLRVNLETGQTPAELTGTAAHWNNSQPGRLFDLVINASNANPIVLLDEVDKAGGHPDHRIDRALYALLDPGSAKEWADASLPSLKMDLRYVMWVLTSNDTRTVPPPLLSRMEVFQVREPSRAEALALARRIFEATVYKFGNIQFSPELPTSLATMLALHPLRIVHRLSRALIASAVRDQRRVVKAWDFIQVRADRAALDAFLVCVGDASPTKH
jgi:ATP-dependent Lon protease